MTNGNKPAIHKNFLFKLRPILRWLIKLRGSIRAIAGGFALGTFLAFTPTIGVQVVLAFFLATLFGLNRPAAVIPVWITNPVTLAPIFTFNYWVGCLFLQGPPVSEVSQKLLTIARELARLDIFAIREQVIIFVQLGGEIIIPLLVGSLVVGSLAGLGSYLVVYRLLTFLHLRRMRKKAARNKDW
ncbi:DUF2062 domain-containing protein [Desulfogranum japonicum]|uniref:DUF2062 domain-containing protein n=1 Tax=Desulfogranum japonicum TaxID=231447 RepID=UPI00041FF699|nr:DUF2062 domain-containing protein [Desulfogranum japonicum]